MTSEQELIRDHASPVQELGHVLRDLCDLFRAVLGERSAYAGQAQSLAGRVDCYKRGRDGLITAQQIVRHGLGGQVTIPLPCEHPRTEAEMKSHARASIRAARDVGKRYGISVDTA